MPLDPLEERAQRRLGTVLRGKYRLERVLGVGGMAVVYKATHRNQAEFAIKMLHPELSINADVAGRFLREGYAANSVKHPGVVRIVDDDVAEDGAAFLVMELLDGIACDHLTSPDGSCLFLDAACAIALELLDVLGAAHAQGVIHRDIKPANLFLLRDGSLKVLDFGIARVRDVMGSGAHATGTGMLLGTPAFMAPEQAIGKSSDVDIRADLWAVGATIFSLASGKMLHDAETAPQLLVKLATQPPQSLAAVLPGAPPAIVGVVDRALAFDKAQRWPTALAMREALEWARRSSLGNAPAPRWVLSSLVASLAPQLPPAAPVAGAPEGPLAAFLPTTPSPAPRPSGRGLSSPSALGTSAPPVVDTESPVSQERRGARGRGPTRRAVVTLVALAAFASSLGVAFVLRSRKSPAPMWATSPAISTGASESPSVPPTQTAAIDSARLEARDSETQDAATSFASKTEQPPRRDVPPHVAPVAHPGPRPAVARPPETAPQPPPSTRPPASPMPSQAPAKVDPLDGRR